MIEPAFDQRRAQPNPACQGETNADDHSKQYEILKDTNCDEQRKGYRRKRAALYQWAKDFQDQRNRGRHAGQRRN